MPETINASVRKTGKISATLRDRDKIRLRSAAFIASKMSDLIDVNASAAEDGAVLVYEDSTSTWKATRTLNKQFVEGGQY